MRSGLLLRPRQIELPYHVPPIAKAVGYTLRTFGPTLVYDPAVMVGQTVNCWDWNHLTRVPNAGQNVQHADGSIGMGGAYGSVADSSGYGASLATTHQNGGTWAGKSFSGGYYIESDIAILTPTIGDAVLPFPAFWSLGSDFCATGAGRQWVGQAVGYMQRPEWDYMQWARADELWCIIGGLIHWYGTPAYSMVVPSGITAHSPPNLRNRNRWAGLHVPATASTQGYVKTFVNGGELRGTLANPRDHTWNQFSDANGPPPVLGTTAGSILDITPMTQIWGTGKAAYPCPMVVYNCSIFQKDESGNLSQ